MAEWLVNSEKAGILLCGSCGNGKTTLLEATCRMINSIYPLSSRVRYEDELFYNRNNHAGIRWETAVKMADMCKKEDDFRSFVQSEWLAIDDLGQEPAEVNDYGNVRYPMRDLLCYRYDRNMLTIVTSNLTPKDISERYGERIADRLREMMAIELFTGKTYRR